MYACALDIYEDVCFELCYSVWCVWSCGEVEGCLLCLLRGCVYNKAVYKAGCVCVYLSVSTQEESGCLCVHPGMFSGQESRHRRFRAG